MASRRRRLAPGQVVRLAGAAQQDVLRGKGADARQFAQLGQRLFCQQCT